MIDWHSHILPKMDDGSRHVEESIRLVQMQAEQGVDIVMATPHFYANDESVESFLERRQISFETLKQASTDMLPAILLGAEVRYYPGISRMPDLRKLTIGNSGLILIEMPVAKWTEYTIRELVELSGMSGLKVVLAHIDRYWDLQKRAVWDKLIESGILMQVNANFFLSFTSKYRALSMLKNGYIHFVGSDCHNITSRPPRIGEAFDFIQKKLGDDFIDQMNAYGHVMIAKQD